MSPISTKARYLRQILAGFVLTIGLTILGSGYAVAEDNNTEATGWEFELTPYL